MLPQMLWYEWLISYIGVVISSLIAAKIYKSISGKQNIKIFKISNFLIILIFSSLMVINTVLNFHIYRILINIIIVIFINKIIFKENILKCIITNLIMYVVLMVLDIAFSGVLLLVTTSEINVLLSKEVFKAMFSTLVALTALLIFEFKIINKECNKIANIILYNKSLPIFFLLILFFTFGNIVLYIYSKQVNATNYIFYMYLFIVFLIFLITSIFQSLKRRQSEEKEKVLLEFMSKYEQIIDRDRVNRHETLNNLLILKSYQDKNTEQYQNTLNQIIGVYENKSSGSLSNIYNLPSGLKGIIYYKVNDMNNSKIKVNTNISNKVVNKFDKLNSKEYFNVCKIIGILMDNALEAAILTKDKEIIIDIYMEENNIIFYIENSCREKVNINLINTKDYSTKGKSRGLGLYIVKSIINKNENIELIQECKKRFVSKLIIKTK